MNINLLNKKTGEAVVDSGVKVKHSQFFFLLNGEHYSVMMLMKETTKMV